MAGDATTRLTIEAEYFRHLTTLSSGAIVVLTVFVEKLFAEPFWKWAVVLAFIAFLFSALSSAVAYSIIVMTQEPLTGPGNVDNIKFSGVVATVVAWAAFFIGLIALIIFAVVNLFGA